MADTISQPRCGGCGRFVDWTTAKCEFTPLSEFGPEKIEWVCPDCEKADEMKRSAA